MLFKYWANKPLKTAFYLKRPNKSVASFYTTSKRSTNPSNHHPNMSASNTSPQTPTASVGRVTFQLTPSWAGNSTGSSHKGPTSPNLKISKEEVFENNLTRLFTKGFLAVLTGMNAELQNDEQRCKDVNSNLYSFWIDLHVQSGCVCVDERAAISNSSKMPFWSPFIWLIPGAGGW